jgi:glucokinase
MSGKRSDAGPVVGIDLGGTNMSIGVVDAKGAILGRCKRKTKAAEGRDVVLSRIVEGVMRACDDAKVPFESLRGVGIGAPSAIDVPEGRVIKAGNLGWEDVPLRAILSEQLRVPVALDNDANCAAWGEAQLGAARGRDTATGGGRRAHAGPFSGGTPTRSSPRCSTAHPTSRPKPSRRQVGGWSPRAT